MIFVNEIWNQNIKSNLKIVFTYKTALHIAYENNDIEIIRLLLKHEKIDVNCKSIYNSKIFNIISN